MSILLLLLADRLPAPMCRIIIGRRRKEMNQQGHKHEQNNKAQTKIILSEQDMLVKRPGIRHASWETKHELRHKMIDEMRIVAKRNEIIIIIYYYFIQFIGIVYALRRVAYVSRCCFRLSYVPAIFVSEHTQRMVGSWVYQSILNVISNLIRFQHLMANFCIQIHIFTIVFCEVTNDATCDIGRFTFPLHRFHAASCTRER